MNCQIPRLLSEGVYQRFKWMFTYSSIKYANAVEVIRKNILCRTMACFEHDLHTLISGEDHVVLALYWSYLWNIPTQNNSHDLTGDPPLTCSCYSIRGNGFLTNLVLSVVKDVPRPWILASFPSSVGFMCCVKDL